MNSQKTYGSLFLSILVVMIGLTPTALAKTSSGETSLKEVKQETRDLMQALKGYTSDQKDQAVRKTKTVLDNLDNRIENLETRIDNNWDKMDKNVRQNARASLKALHKQRTHVAEWYGSMKSSSAGAWDHMKNGFSKAYKDLHKAWEKAENEFDSGK